MFFENHDSDENVVRLASPRLLCAHRMTANTAI